MVVFIGRYNGVLAYPRFIASYTVPVRQYRILQSRFLQCLLHSKPPCGLLILPRFNQGVWRTFTSWRNSPTLLTLNIKIVFLILFQSMGVGVRCSCRAHTAPMPNSL